MSEQELVRKTKATPSIVHIVHMAFSNFAAAVAAQISPAFTSCVLINLLVTDLLRLMTFCWLYLLILMCLGSCYGHCVYIIYFVQSDSYLFTQLCQFFDIQAAASVYIGQLSSVLRLIIFRLISRIYTLPCLIMLQNKEGQAWAFD